MIYILGGLAAIWIGAALLAAVGMWRAGRITPRTVIPRCACGKVPLPGGRGHLDHPAIRHSIDVCSPQREVIR